MDNRILRLALTLHDRNPACLAVVVALGLAGAERKPLPATQPNLATMAHSKLRSVERALPMLEEVGVLECARDDRGRTEYRLSGGKRGGMARHSGGDDGGIAPPPSFLSDQGSDPTRDRSTRTGSRARERGVPRPDWTLPADADQPRPELGDRTLRAVWSEVMATVGEITPVDVMATTLNGAGPATVRGGVLMVGVRSWWHRGAVDATIRPKLEIALKMALGRPMAVEVVEWGEIVDETAE